MGIEDIQISEELETNAPSIKYSGNEGPKSPQEMEQMMIASLEEEYAKYRFDMLEQGLEPMDFDSFRREATSDQAAIDPKIRIEEVVKEFIRVKGRKPNSLDELKEFFEMRMGTAKNPGMEVVKELVEDDKTRITLAGGSFPDLSGDGEITQEDILIGKGVIKRDEKQSGGLAAILGL